MADKLKPTNVGKSTHFRELFIKSRLKFCENVIKIKNYCRGVYVYEFVLKSHVISPYPSVIAPSVSNFPYEG